MADTAVETVLGIIEGQGGTSTARTLVPALVDLGEIIAGGGELADGSVTTDKLADAAVTSDKIAVDSIDSAQIRDGVITADKLIDYGVTIGKIATSAVDTIRTIDIHSADATVQAALSQMGVTTSITPPASMIDPTDMTGEWTDANFHLCWLNTSSQLELAPIVVESTAGGGLMAYAIGKDSTASGLMGVDSAWTVTANSSGGGGTQTTWYGTSTTTAGTADKAVTCDGFELKRGAMIAVYFGKANTTYTPKLNVNSTGAKSIYYNNTALSSTYPLLWGAGAMLTFVCDGTNFHLLNRPTNAYGISGTAAGTANKETQDSIKALVVDGTMVSVLFSTKNTVADAIYLNVDGTGNSKIRGANGSDTSSSNTLFWDNNTVLTFIRKGSNWVFVSASKELPTTAPA